METSEILNSLSWIDSIAGGVWLVLSSFTVYTLIKVKKKYGIDNSLFQLGLFLLLSIWLYPAYTLFFSNLAIGQIGNIFTLFITLVYLYFLKKAHIPSFKIMLPQVAWLFVAIVYLGLQLGFAH